MSNIYDVFNMRKEGLTSLQEGVEFGAEELAGMEEVVFENFEDPCAVLEDIMMESAEEFIEVQGAIYMNELVLENAMYDKFDEAELTGLMEAAEEEKKKKLSETIKTQWNKLTTWFKQTFVNITNFFTSGEELVKKYRNDIPKAVKACDVTVSVNEYVPVGTAIGKCDAMIANIKAAGTAKSESTEESKAAILKAVGASDRSGVAKAVRNAFVTTEKPVEKKISSLDVNVLLDYAGNKKAILDSINKSKSNIDKEFKEILGLLNVNTDAKNKTAIGAFQFAISVKNTVINAEIACVKKGASDCKAIINKAIGGNRPTKPEKMSKEDVNNKKKELVNKQLARRGVAVKESLNFEDVSFGDEE